MLRYNINTGVNKIKTKAAVAMSVATLGLGGLGFAVAVPFAAHAEGNVAGSNASACGSYHGAVASEYGNYGFLGGLHGTPYYDANVGKTVQADRAVGQQPGGTGYNNSQPCGQQL